MLLTKKRSGKVVQQQVPQSYKPPPKTVRGAKVRKATTGDRVLLGTARYEVSVQLDAKTRLPIEIVFRQMTDGDKYLAGDDDDVYHAVTLPRWSATELGDTIALEDVTIVDLPISLRVVAELPA